MYAPGIPDRSVKAKLPAINSPVKFEYVVQAHDSHIAKLHYDLRLGDPKTGNGHSWALRYLPGPGEQTLAVEQPTHTIGYFDFTGKIGPGYGAGTVAQHARGQVEIIHSEPNKITFWDYSLSSGPQKFTLLRTNGDQWLCINHTLPGGISKFLDEAKPMKYKDMAPGKYMPAPGDFVTPKIDGASSTTILRPDKTPVIYGKRISKRTGNRIEYTPKIPGAMTERSPKSLGNTVLRTEVFSVTPQGVELPNRTLGGILNSDVYKSRETQKNLSAPLRIAAFDILRFKGKDVSGLPIEDKYKLIAEVSRQYPLIKNPLDLQKQIKFNEGSVIWRNGKPIKVKNKQDFDVYVRGVFPNIAGNRAGGFEYSLTKNGPIVGRAGTGFNHDELKDMMARPDAYIGRVAKLEGMEQYGSGALRAPSFKGFHIDKGEYDV